MNNTRFSTAIHILTLLAKSPNDWLTSDWIAGSININPVVVRKELSVLRNVGLVISKQGKDGGAQLSKSAKDIKLSDIFSAVNDQDLLGKKNQNPNPECNIGKDINEKLNQLYAEVDQKVENYLETKTLEEFCQNFD